MKGIRKRVRFYFFACCFASAWILLAAQVPDATDNPAIIKGGLFFGITDDPIPSGAGSLELLKDTYLVSTSFCQCVIHNNGSNFEPLLVPGRNLTPFKIELKDRTGKAIPMTHLGREVSKAPNTSSSRWRDILPWGKRESAFLHWHSNPGGTRFVEFPNINQHFEIKYPGDYLATVRIRYWVRTNTTWSEKLSEPAAFIWHVPATNAPPKK